MVTSTGSGSLADELDGSGVSGSSALDDDGSGVGSGCSTPYGAFSTVKFAPSIAISMPPFSAEKFAADSYASFSSL